MTGLVVVSPPPLPAVTLAEAKLHLRVDHSDEDALIGAFIAAATRYAEAFMGRTLVDTTFDLVLDKFPTARQPIVLPRPPLIAVEGIYLAGDGSPAETEMLGYVVDSASQPARILAPSIGWPTGTLEASIRIRYRAGYVSYDALASPPVTAGEVPRDIAAALLLYIGSLYQQRENAAPNAMTTIPWGAEQLLRMHRVEMGMA